MRILAYNEGHDGAIVFLDGGKLVYCVEAEKDNGQRHAWVSTRRLSNMAHATEGLEALAVSAWSPEERIIERTSGPSYFGVGADATSSVSTHLFGHDIFRYTSSHERSHLFCSYGLSPFPQGMPCYVLTWEGSIGAFYYIDEQVRIFPLGTVLPEPGNKYALLYSIADSSMPATATEIRLDDAGKLMALAAYSGAHPPTADEQALIEAVLPIETIFGHPHKQTFAQSPFFNIGVESDAFKALARQFTDRLFDEFFRFAERTVKPGLPLLISGGCGLNCEWNSRWQACGLFSDVFVPPCTNDSGVALGGAIDAQHHYTGNAKVEWSVYAGEDFEVDAASVPGFTEQRLNLGDLSRRLAAGDIIGWVQGRYEIGPRALGNRSILAAPFYADTQIRLNRIKQREGFRPIAPVCREEEIKTHFDAPAPSPHMLYFQNVKSDRLRAVTHVDRSARAQSVNARENPILHELLSAFGEQTGTGVLCNTSLNFKGRGFINRMSDLSRYALEHGLDGLVVGNTWYVRDAAIADR